MLFKMYLKQSHKLDLSDSRTKLYDKTLTQAAFFRYDNILLSQRANNIRQNVLVLYLNNVYVLHMDKFWGSNAIMQNE